MPQSGEVAVIKITLIVLLMLISISAWGDWAIKGEGNYSCPDYVSAKRTNGAKLYSSVTWVQGFISGMNYQRALDEDINSVVGRDFPTVSIVSWLENYCRDHPADDIADAAEVFIKENE